MNYLIGAVSSAHTMGNVATLVTEYIKEQFPENFFKSTVIATSIAHREISVNTNHTGFLRKRKPVLHIRPRIEIDNSDMFMYDTLMTTRITDSFADIDFSHLFSFMIGTNKEFYTQILMNRIKMNFDVTMVFSHKMQQINTAIYLKNMVRLETPFIINGFIENQIPKQIINVISSDNKIPIRDEHGSLKPFLDFMNTRSLYPISYKFQNSSGTEEFFRFANVNIDAMMSKLDVEDGGKNNMIESNSSISFVIQTEFSIAGLYYYFSRTLENKVLPEIPETDDHIIPLYTPPLIANVNIPFGWKMYTTALFNVDESVDTDELDFSSLLSQDILLVIQHQLDYDLSSHHLLKFDVMCDNRQLQEGKDYIVNIEKKILETKYIRSSGTYRFSILVNTLHAQNLIKEIENLDKNK